MRPSSGPSRGAPRSASSCTRSAGRNPRRTERELFGPAERLLPVECRQCREELSARIDGEATRTAPAVDGHLSACAACRDWLGAGAPLTEPVRALAQAPVPDQAPAILAALADEAAASTAEAERAALRPWRAGLAAVAIAQLLMAAPV